MASNAASGMRIKRLSCTPMGNLFECNAEYASLLEITPKPSPTGNPPTANRKSDTIPSLWSCAAHKNVKGPARSIAKVTVLGQLSIKGLERIAFG